jgi:hypothetical protein
MSWPSRIALKARNKFQAYREKAKSPQYRKERRERWTIIGLFVAAGFALLQWIELRNTDQATHDLASAAKTQSEALGQQAAIMQGQLDELKRQFGAIERQSTVGRAYIIVDFVAANTKINFPPQNKLGIVTVSYALKNIGETPAVVDLVKGSYFVSEKPIPTSIDVVKSVEIFDNPKFGSDASPWMSREGTMGISESNPELSEYLDITNLGRQIIIPAHSSTAGVQSFTFSNRPDLMENGTPSPSWFVVQGWLKVIIGYKDIYGFGRETCFLAHGDGQIAAVTPSQTAPKEEACNYWN